MFSLEGCVGAPNTMGGVVRNPPKRSRLYEGTRSSFTYDPTAAAVDHGLVTVSTTGPVQYWTPRQRREVTRPCGSFQLEGDQMNPRASVRRSLLVQTS